MKAVKLFQGVIVIIVAIVALHLLSRIDFETGVLTGISVLIGICMAILVKSDKNNTSESKKDVENNLNK